MFYGWGRNKKIYDLGNGYALICVYKYFHIWFILRFVTSKEWFLQEISSQHTKAIKKRQVEQLLGRRVPFIHDYGAIFGNEVKELDWHGTDKQTSKSEKNEETRKVISESVDKPAITQSNTKHKKTKNRKLLRYYVSLSIFLFILSLVIASKAKTTNDGLTELSGLTFLLSAAIFIVCIIVWLVRLFKRKKKTSSMQTPKNKTHQKAGHTFMTRKKLTWALSLLAIIILIAVVYTPLSNYLIIKTANPTMVKLAQQAGMSREGELLFLRTKPQLVTDSQMESDCSSNTAASNADGFIEQGCYSPTTNRIYIRKMPTDLYSLEVATAAYEMLHPVYISLTNSGAGKALNASIEANYKTINDANLNQQVANFNKTEPGEIDLELFSLLGTGYSSLTSDLNNYYSPYFSDISKTVAANNQVYQLFQSDAGQLNSLNDSYNQYQNLANKANSDANSAYQYSVDAANNGDAYYNNYNYNIYKQDIAAYNSDVETINNTASQFNSLLNDYNNLITEFNGTQPVAQLQTDQSQNPQSQ